MSHRVWRLSLMCVLMCYLLPRAASIQCVQCNMRERNIGNSCDDPRQMTDCLACLKTRTKVRIKDSGYINGRDRVSEVISRYCLLPGSSRIKPEGCYKWQNNGGYTEQCYCYSDNCNSGASRPFVTSYSTAMLGLPLIVITVINHL